MSSLTEILSNRGVDEIILIDDSFDAPQNEDNYEKITEFMEEISDNPDAQIELKSMGFDITEREQLSNDVLKALWLRQSSLKGLKAAFDKCIYPIWDRKQEPFLASFRQYLTTLNLKYKCIGPNEEFIPSEKNIVFVDYYMAPIGTQQDASAKTRAVQESIKVIKRILEVCNKTANKGKPLIIMMSSFPEDVSLRAQALVREQTGLLAGMYYFISKHNMPDTVFLTLKLEAIASSLPHRYEVQHFVDSVRGSIDDVVLRFIKDILELSLEDYAAIQKLSLMKDGQPLGDYLLWLYSSYFGHLLFEKTPKVKAEQHKLNSIYFDELPLNQNAASHILTDIYASALYLEVDDIGEHPLPTKLVCKTESEVNSDAKGMIKTGAESKPGTEPKSETEPMSDGQAQVGTDVCSNLYFHLGDIFLDDTGANIFMVISAQCDLAFSPRNPKRGWKANKTIIFVPGVMTAINEIADLDETVTDIFKYNNKECKIKWNVKEVVTKTFGDVSAWLTENDLKRRYRLRLPYALGVQHAFVSDLSRVGMPVRPPIPQRAIAKVYYWDLEVERPVLLFTNDDEVSMALSRKEHHLRFTENFVIGFRAGLKVLSSELRERAVMIGQPNKDKILKYSDKLAALSNNISALKELWKSEFPENKQSKVIQAAIRIMKNGDVEEWPSKNELICLNVEIVQYAENEN